MAWYVFQRFPMVNGQLDDVYAFKWIEYWIIRVWGMTVWHKKMMGAVRHRSNHLRIIITFHVHCDFRLAFILSFSMICIRMSNTFTPRLLNQDPLTTRILTVDTCDGFYIVYLSIGRAWRIIIDMTANCTTRSTCSNDNLNKSHGMHSIVPGRCVVTWLWAGAATDEIINLLIFFLS